MSRILPALVAADHGKHIVGGEPLVFHCNFYNYFLQKTILLDPELGMEQVIMDAAESSVHALLSSAKEELGLQSPEDVARMATDHFAENGFGTIDLSDLVSGGSRVTVPVSHYGRCTRQASGADFAAPQSLFDAGFSAAVASLLRGEPTGTFQSRIDACQALGDPVGQISLHPREEVHTYSSAGIGAHFEGAVPPAFSNTNVDEAGILAALAGLDFSGNEEGLLPRFGVMLTNHYANFYNRISFEFVHRMAGTGLLEAAEMLLVEAGYRCAFHTLGGIMISPEWDAVVKPQCKTPEDWVHGIVACVNSLGWGVWRVQELSKDRLVVRIYDDYESCGYLGMYGKVDRPQSFLGAGGVAGIMNLIFVGNIHEKPVLDFDYYVGVFESSECFGHEFTKSVAMGDNYTEIVAFR